MEEPYFSFALKRKQKKTKRVNFTHEEYNLSDLNNIVNETLKNMRTLKNSQPKKKFNLLKLLDEIIPNIYFGTSCHRKLFYKIANKIFTLSAHECIYTSTIIKGYNYTYIPWLHNIKCPEVCKLFLLKANTLLLEVVVKGLITYYHKHIKTNKSHEIQFFPKDAWDQFQTKVLNQLQKSKFLVKVSGMYRPYSRGFFKILPKGPLENLKFRPLVNGSQPKDKIFLRSLVKKIYDAAEDMKCFTKSLYDAWLGFVQSTGDAQLFGVKCDVEDAFGSVDVPFLCQTIQGVKPKFLSDSEKAFLVQYIRRQVVVFKKYVYKWEHGLLQGDVLSAALCELYMARCDQIFIRPLETGCFLHRIVDDYFYCSTEKFRVADFVEDVKLAHKINESKTVSNLEDPSQEIPYCGKVFNLTTKAVKILISFPDGYEIRHTFKLWHQRTPIPETDPILFIRTAMKISFSSNCFAKMMLNTIFNSQKVVLENFFDGMVYVAYKFDATLQTLCSNYLLDNFQQIYGVLMYCIKPYVGSARRTIIFAKGGLYKSKISFSFLLILALKAFILVLKQRSVYKNLILLIKKNQRLKRLTSRLTVHFSNPDVDPEYFNKLPLCFAQVQIRRTAVI